MTAISALHMCAVIARSAVVVVGLAMLVPPCVLLAGWPVVGVAAEHKADGNPKAQASAAAASKVSQLACDDRGLKIDQYGWRPADKSTVPLNPPGFIWPHEDQATKTPCYTLQWAKSKYFCDAVTIENLRLNAYAHNQPLEPGRYYWRYRYQRAGVPSDWSYVRSFTVTAEAIVFPMPSAAQCDRLIPREHPRLFLRPEDLPQLRALALGDGAQAAAFAAVRQRADRALAAPLPHEPQGKQQWNHRVQTLDALVDGEVLAFAYLITQDQKYGAAAEKWLLNFAAWDPLQGATSLAGFDEASLPMLHRMARIYDWAYEALAEQTKGKVLAVLKIRAAEEWKGYQMGAGVGHLTWPYGSHANRAWHKLGEMAIATYRELPESELYLDYALSKFFCCYPVWSDEDGGWHEGLRYWNDYMAKAI
jgi:hypothetical protein